MKSISAILVSALLGAFFMGVYLFSTQAFDLWTPWTFWTPSSTAVATSHAATIKALQDLGEMVVLKVCVGDVIENEGYGFTGVYLVKGDGLVAVNFRKAKLIASDEASRSLTIQLPAPYIMQPRIDHEKTKTYDYKKHVWFGGNKDAP